MASVCVHKDLKETIINIPEELEPSKCWIHRVPDKLREINPAAYTPRLVSIGPLHYGDPKLKAMEYQKLKYQEQFLKREFCEHVTLDDMLNFMQDHLEKDPQQCIQHSYAVTFVDWMDFRPIILRDACFIFELFLRNYEIQLYEKILQKNAGQVEPYSEEYILRTPWLKEAISQDLILLENQLPYFVLAKLFDFIFIFQNPTKEIKIPNYLAKELTEERKRYNFFMKITLEFFIDYCKFANPRAKEIIIISEECTKDESESKSKDLKDEPESKSKSKDKKVESKPKGLFSADKFGHIKHFTDLVREIMRPVKPFPKDETAKRCFYSAIKLDSAGVTIVCCKENTVLADIKKKKKKETGNFFKCVFWNYFELQIPTLKVQDNTECIMRNVMAFEQFVYPKKPYICNYVFLLDQLISTVEDVDFLVDKKIVENWLGSNKAVVRMVNKLCDQIVQSHFFYSDLSKKLNTHCDNPWNAFKATLKRVYFKDIWTRSSTFVAIVFLIFSLFAVFVNIKKLFF